jgi:hypothetical protein
MHFVNTIHCWRLLLWSSKNSTVHVRQGIICLLKIPFIVEVSLRRFIVANAHPLIDFVAKSIIKHAKLIPFIFIHIALRKV